MLHLITGGERSGKTRYGMRLAEQLAKAPLYVATARVWDADFRERIEQHKLSRGVQWVSIEEEKQLSNLDLKNKVAVIDCVTLWLTNFWVDTNHSLTASLRQAQEEIDKLAVTDAILFIISNEIGMSVHADTKTVRKFVELQGLVNQYIAEKADAVTLMIAGIPLTVKS
ncbi:MAG TPA: bifunctional adenosylcobinamide kinase/adenosylcobinamide-phosphate guanylyltransferase [Candidatus Saccharimonadales bacterium]|nr:bifunctional adenosylcobinamide kinase/adenosylcobinamide-phosphate guanylyltransferase [Candidatus Saccharimonadales bacterium]